MACHTEGWVERRQPPSADRNWLRHLAAPAGCRQEGKIFLARTVYTSAPTDIRVWRSYYRKTSNISLTLLDNKIVDNTDVVGAPPVGAAPTPSSFST